MKTTRLSSKSQVIIPQTIREVHHWTTGVEFMVINTDIRDVLGCVDYKGKKRSIRDMEKGILKGSRKHK